MTAPADIWFAKIANRYIGAQVAVRITALVCDAGLGMKRHR